MKPSKITLEGDYWDCQIYRGRLYLWTMEGSLKVVDWYSLVKSLEQNISQHLPLSCAFTDGGYLYNYALKNIFYDPEFKKLLQDKFLLITKKDFILDERSIDKYLIGLQDNPFGELQIDSEISSNRVYALTEDALLSATAHRSKGNPVSSKLKNHFSINAFSIKANNYSRFAISAGADGLFEFDALLANERHVRGDQYVKQILNSHSSFADYSFFSIYNSSLVGDSCLAYQRYQEMSPENWSNDIEVQRANIKFEKSIPEDQIFKIKSDQKTVSWGTNEKLYKAVNGGIALVRFNNFKPEETFSETELIKVDSQYGNILCARTAYYGTIVEYDNALVVLLSDFTRFVIEGPITRWRIYPRSYNYENHLHVIKENCVEIYSFNNDYFQDQVEKVLGISYKIRQPFTRKRKVITQNISNSLKFNDKDLRVDNKGHIDALDVDDLPF